MNMQTLIDSYLEDEGEALHKRFAAYLQHLHATARWHHDHADSRCPHDAWVEHLTINESAMGDRQQYRSIDIYLRLLGAYHDGHLELAYRDVRSYTLATPPDCLWPPSNGAGHGDWLIDDIGLSERGLVLHSILFSRGSRWTIE
jgi:hypothetical protein